jgi:putative transposase
VERFNGSYRRAILDAYIFRNIEEVRELTERWRTDYNERRPHEELGNMTPQEYKEMLLTGEIRSLGHSVPAAEANP